MAGQPSLCRTLVATLKIVFAHDVAQIIGSSQALGMYKKVKMESNAMKNQSGGVRYIPQSPGELDGLMFPQLQRVHQQLKSDLEKIEQVSDGSFTL